MTTMISSNILDDISYTDMENLAEFMRDLYKYMNEHMEDVDYHQHKALETTPYKFFIEDVDIKGSFDEPLFNARDIAYKIKDGDHYKRFIKDHKIPAEYYDVLDGSNRLVSTPYLTEDSVYQYLLESKKPLTKEFQRQIRKELISCRKEVIDNLTLQNKALYEKLEYCKEMRVSLVFSTFDRKADASHKDFIKYCVTKYFSKSVPDGFSPNFTWCDVESEMLWKIVNIVLKYFDKGAYKDCENEIVDIIVQQHIEFTKQEFEENNYKTSSSESSQSNKI